MNRAAGLFVLAVMVTAVCLLARLPAPTATSSYADPVRELLSGGAAGFATADAPVEFRFPRDHAAHPGFQTEWWYFTGHLRTARAEQFGFQLTLFRYELAPKIAASKSAWRTGRVLMAHFALSDFANARFDAFERFGRAHPDIASAGSEAPRVQLDDWTIERVPGAEERWRLRAHDDGHGIDLELRAEMPIIAQGERGLSRKSSSSGNASYYYSIPRLSVRGHLQRGDSQQAVEGTAWLDREWSTSALDRTQQGWDWFALQFETGDCLMFYHLRDARGAADAFSSGVYVSSDGLARSLDVNAVQISPGRRWTSPVTRTSYPLEWRIKVPDVAIDIAIEPVFDAQEWRHRFRYWEGAVRVSGTHAGRGYMELTGY